MVVSSKLQQEQMIRPGSLATQQRWSRHSHVRSAPPNYSEDELSNPHTNYCLSYEVTGWIMSPDKPDVEVLGLRTRPCDINDTQRTAVGTTLPAQPNKEHTWIESQKKRGMCITHPVGPTGALLPRTMPRLHNVSSVRRRGPRGGGTSGGGRRRPGAAGGVGVGTTPGLLSTASTSAGTAAARTGGKPVVSTGGNHSGDIAAQSTGGTISDATEKSGEDTSGGGNALHVASMDGHLMEDDSSLGGVRKSLDATFRHSQSPPAADATSGASPSDTAREDTATAAAMESLGGSSNAGVEAPNTRRRVPTNANDDDMDFHPSQCDTINSEEAADDDKSVAAPSQASEQQAAAADALVASTSRPSSRRRRRKVRKGEATAGADTGTASAPSADESAENNDKSGDEAKMSDALAAVMAIDDEDTNGKGQEDGNGNDATNTDDIEVTIDTEQQQQKQPAKKKKSSRPSKMKRRIVGSRVIECEKAPPFGAAPYSPLPEEPAARKRRKMSVGFDESAAAGGVQSDDEDVAAKNRTATPSSRVKRGQPAVPNSGISLNSVASTPCAARTPGHESGPDTPADVAHIQGLFDQLNEQVRRAQEEHDAEKKSIHQKWQRKHAKTKERCEAKVRQYQLGYDNLSKEFDNKFAQVNRERAEEKTGFQKKEKMLSERIETLTIELEKKDDKLGRWRGRMQEAKKMHAEAWEINDRCGRLKESLDAREGRLKSLEENYESRNASLEEKHRKYKEQLQRKERELARRERKKEASIRKKIEAEMAEKQSLRSIGQSVAQKLIGFGGGSGSDADGAAGDPLHQQRLLLDERESRLDDRERDLDARERALQGKDVPNCASSPSKRTPTKKQSVTSRYANDDSLFDSPASRTRTRTRSSGNSGSSSSFDTPPSGHIGGGKRKKAPQTPSRTSPRKKVKVVRSVRSAPPAVKSGGDRKKPAQKAKKKLIVMDASDSESSEDF